MIGTFYINHISITGNFLKLRNKNTNAKNYTGHVCVSLTYRKVNSPVTTAPGQDIASQAIHSALP